MILNMASYKDLVNMTGLSLGTVSNVIQEMCIRDRTAAVMVMILSRMLLGNRFLNIGKTPFRRHNYHSIAGYFCQMNTIGKIYCI